MIECFENQMTEGLEETVGDRLAVGPIDRPAQRVDHHLADQRRDGQDPRPVVDRRKQLRVEHHRHTADIGSHRGLMLQSDGNPGGLLRRQQKVRRRGLDLDHPADRVLDLMQIMRVPPRDQPVALVEVTAGAGATAVAQLDETGRSEIKLWPKVRRRSQESRVQVEA